MSILKKHQKIWFARIFIVVCLTLIGGLCVCENPYTTNPNLKLLVGDTTTKYDSTHCTYPVVIPNGNVVYYLCVNPDSFLSFGAGVGSIYSINTDGSDNQKLIDGKFNSLAISHDGTKLAAHIYSGSYRGLTPESLIVVIYLNNQSVSDIDSFWVTPKHTEKIEWSANDDYLYYSTIDYANFKTIVYGLDVSNSTEEVVQSIAGVVGFDLFGDNSIYSDDSIASQLQIEPVSEEYAIGVYGYLALDFLMRDLSSNTLFDLPDSCVPYVDGSVGYPYWFPDGNTIVFSAQPYKAGSGAPAEIWILENVFEQIGE